MSRAVYFKVTCTETKVGWHLRAVGGCQALGEWDPARGAPLSTSAAKYPTWKSAAVYLEEEAVVEYKYVICNEAGVAVKWEATPNRVLHIAALAARGLCARSGSLTTMEGFGTVVPLDAVRFRSEQGSSYQELPESVHPSVNRTEDVELFEPTLRERAQSSELRPPEAAGGELESEMDGMVREASSSNLELPPGNEPRVFRAFERQYTLVGGGPLGEGTFGLVWLCRPHEGGVERAAKIVRKARLSQREQNYLLGANGEINTHLTMKHPHIVELFEHFDEQDFVTLVLEYCQGGDLFDAIIRHSHTHKEKGLPTHQGAVATKHTFSALAYLHKQSVVHRDIKCENILLSRVCVPFEHNVFKLCDFGFAAHDQGDGLYDRLGSPDTVAPEVVAGLRYSCPADVWSMGCVVYMMLSATSPFKAVTDAEVLRKVLAGSYCLQGSPWDRHPAQPKQLIASLMTVDAKLRPTAKAVLQDPWLEGVPAGAAAN